MLSVEKFWKASGKVFGLSTQSTAKPKYLTSQVFSIPSFYTQTTRYNFIFTQVRAAILYLSDCFLSPYSTSPINKTINK